MDTKDLVVRRLRELCFEHDIALNSLANLSGITPSTVYSITDRSRKDVGIVTLKKLCDGLGISLFDFFDTDYFRDMEQELV
ncbi:MAG: helix-turn-helix domain-containing protein [Acetanaerobacterium sp.]